jgi:hypothetical protein
MDRLVNAFFCLGVALRRTFLLPPCLGHHSHNENVEQNSIPEEKSERLPQSAGEIPLL